MKSHIVDTPSSTDKPKTKKERDKEKERRRLLKQALASLQKSKSGY